MKRFVRPLMAALLLLAMQGCGGGEPAPAEQAPAAVDQTDPSKVVEAIFAVAAGKMEAKVLASFCDPAGENDADTRRICDNATGFDPGGEFAMFFKRGTLTGKAEIQGGFASVPFLFGPTGTDPESMDLVQRDGKWYLIGF